MDASDTFGMRSLSLDAAPLWTELRARPRLAARIGIVSVVVAATFLIYGAVRGTLEWRRTTQDVTLLAANLRAATVAVSRDVDALRTQVGTTCDASTVRMLVRASLLSAYSRHYAMLTYDGQLCGPLGKESLASTDIVGDAAREAHPAARLVSTGIPRAQRVWLVLERKPVRFAIELSPSVSAGLDGFGEPSAPRWHRLALGDISAGQHAGWGSIQAPTIAQQQVVAILQPVAMQRMLWSDLPWLLAVAALALLAGRVALDRLVSQRVDAVQRMRRAIRKRRFEPWIQPIVDATTGAVVGGEVLMRWSHPARGILPPGEFIDLAEATGMIELMSEIIMSKARDRLAPAIRANPALYFSFNVTPRELASAELIDRLLRLFDDESLPRRNVLLEITERDLVDERAVHTLHRLRELGFRIAIDDFGTGQSALSQLDRLPADRLKVDRAFVQGIRPDGAAHPVLDAIIAMAHGLGLPLIAEGVETEAQQAYLRARGVQSLQGYLFARPLPITEYLNQYALAGTSTAEPTTVEFDALVYALQGARGIEIRDRWYHLRRYRSCFIASDAVTWIQSTLGVSRERAVRIGERLTALGHIEHVVEEHDFRDGHLFFRVRPAASDDDSRVPRTDPETIGRALRAQRDAIFGWRPRGLLCFEGAARGEALVHWMQQHFALTEADALLAGSLLLRRGVLQHAFDDRPFTASRELYRLARRV